MHPPLSSVYINRTEEGYAVTLDKSTYYKQIVESMVGEAPDDEISEILKESYDLDNESSQMNYLFRMEQFFDDNDIYAFDGWQDGVIYGEPEISKFWFKVDILFPPKLDLDAAIRIIGKHNENRIGIKRLSDNRFIVRVHILRHVLDDIERENRKESAKEARLVGEPKNPDGSPILGGEPEMDDQFGGMPQGNGGGNGSIGGGF